ncbi:hypothetical protein LY90DRAFT_672360 [Neocallimastix californiae]|uniref:Uncharacterized protein n=1 Tax=Neocallimastix californiae TaxID=1754190 RepID=A0A1Y2C0G2_9FUNG|nr:hypothetical protein LY90DRAFT_672360 [Neocallimastix californiae]|eukprot:ORY39805.1 hypothetical protein LY90DRAFT_672360 [Neocallimastix californiae]
MDKADSNLLSQLFKENNDLRAKINELNRNIFNKTVQNENAEDEIKQLQSKINLLMNENKKISTRKFTPASPSNDIFTKTLLNDKEINEKEKNISVALGEAEKMIEEKNNEISLLKKDLSQAKTYIEQQKVINYKLESEFQECKDKLSVLQTKEENENIKNNEQVDTDVKDIKISLRKSNSEVFEDKKNKYKDQILDISNSSNLKFNNQQIQLQGIESLVESIRLEYEEFIESTKLENESYIKIQKEEFEALRTKFMQYKQEQNQKQRDSYWEFQSLLYAMQTQFEEYRATSEFMFNSEIAKMEDEIASLTLRYEQEILYIAQAKDQFYSDMMVTKDAKIMNIIEGSDLKEVIKHHELEIENIRREHAFEIERIKSEQESEQSNIIALLQRQNSALESKCEKLSTHMKSQEDKLKDMLSIINQKNKIIIDKEDEKDKIELNLQKQLTTAMNKVYTLTQDCEYLRNKIIRLSLNAKGEGGNSIKNILKRITRETDKLSNDFNKVSSNYTNILNEFESNNKKLKEKEKLVAFLEKEVKRRTEEFDSMAKTFEDFITQRAKQLRLERSERLMKMLEQQKLYNENENSTNYHFNHKKGTIKTIIPSSMQNINKISLKQSDSSQEKIELERGFEYLKRFKALSRAFKNGEMNRTIISTKNQSFSQENGPWTKTELYNRVFKPINVHVPRIYNPNEHNKKETMAKFIGNNIDEWYRNNDESYKASLYKPLENQEAINER